MTERVLILAPGGNAARIGRELDDAGLVALTCESAAELCRAVRAGAGAAVVADEAMIGESVELLAEELRAQPPWSDLPVLVLAGTNAGDEATRAQAALLERIENASLMEQPLGRASLLSTIRMALRARRRQYQIASHLERIEQNELALQRSEAHLRLLSDLGEAMLSQGGCDDVAGIVVRRLGEYLGAQCCTYGTFDADSESVVVVSEYREPGCRSLAEDGGPWLFGRSELRDLQEGRCLVIRNAEQEVPEGDAKETLGALRARAVVAAPLLREGHLGAVLAVFSSTPRSWTEHEAKLVEDAMGRCWGHAERERLMRELAAKSEVLTSTSRELEEFAYVASHDLQEPLRMVRIYTQLILRDLGQISEPIRKYADFVDHGAHRMEELLRDLLTFSRAVHLERPGQGKVRLEDALAEALEAIRNQLEETGAKVTAQNLPEVQGDQAQLAQVFRNLLSNAIRYRRQDGPLEISIAARPDSGRWVVEVRDNGIGFEQAYAERIFGLFKRLHKDEYPGTGLGLAICKRIVQRHSGQIWARSTPGQGSSFFFSLPEATQVQKGSPAGTN